MKKNVLIISLLLFSLPLFAERVDPETARKVATTFLSNKGAKATQLNDLSKTAGFKNLYIFTTEKSFVVMSADNCVQPILGYSTENPFEAENIPANLRWWLDGYDERIDEINQSKDPMPVGVLQEWEDLMSGKIISKTGDSSSSVAPLISSAWHQKTPFNNLCPANTVTGCVATAMAQVMNFWKYPEQGIGSHSYIWDGTTHSADYGATTYEWDNMLNSYAEDYTTAQANAVATLMRHCGVSVEMKYTVGGESGSTISRACNALKTYFNYSGTYLEKSSFENDSTWISRVKADLGQGWPLLYGGSYANEPGGHAFVCDGYDDSDKLHFNWGWGPGSVGYYTVNGHQFSRGQNAVFGIRPIECNADKPSQLACSQQEGHTVTLTWIADDDAISHNIYRNNTLIANANASSYIDADAVLGENIYYIRSIDEDGDLSLASNPITVNVAFQTPAVSDLNANFTNGTPTFSWPTPWWHPQTTTGTIAYVDGSRPEFDTYMGWNEYENLHLYWGCRYPAEDLAQHQGEALFMTSFYTYYPGNYKVLIYQGTKTVQEAEHDSFYPLNLKLEQSITTAKIGWVNIKLDEPIFIDNSQDLWVFLYDGQGTIRKIPCLNIAVENHNQYLASDLGANYPRPPHVGCYLWEDNPPFSWFIRNFVTDGTYTYNLYDGNAKVNGDMPISGTSYSITEPLSKGIHQFTVKTNYNGGESAASNKISVTVDTIALQTLALDTDDAMVVTEGSTLIVSGNITNTDPANLIIEEGGQLIHPNCTVQATLKKNINAYSNVTGVNDGWYTIASPIDAFSVDNLTQGDYDLYAYNEKDMLWLNQKVSTNNITEFKEGKGFLYANATTTPLAFAGSMKATDEQATVTLRCLSSDENLKGFNLVGNPFSRNLGNGDITLNGNPVTTYYSVEGGTELASHSINTDPIKPGQGFLVQATSDGQELVFNPSSSKSREEVKPSYISIEASDESFTDRAIVQFGEGNTLHKTTLSDNTPKLSVWHHNADYATVIIDTENELPLHFNAVHDGLHTLNVNIENLDLDFLHLIDNIAGTDIDLLVTPNYTFEAQTDDYPSRFRLLFNANDNPNIDSNDIDSGVTQIFDMTGRLVGTDRDKLVPGIYIVRTINGDEVKTEKIVVNGIEN